MLFARPEEAILQVKSHVYIYIYIYKEMHNRSLFTLLN